MHEYTNTEPHPSPSSGISYAKFKEFKTSCTRFYGARGLVVGPMLFYQGVITAYAGLGYESVWLDV